MHFSKVTHKLFLYVLRLENCMFQQQGVEVCKSCICCCSEQ